MSYFRQPNVQVRPIERAREILKRLFPGIFPIFKPSASIVGWDLQIIGGGQTTERRTTGEQGIDFRFYPVLSITPDVNGDFRVEWEWHNLFPDGAPAGYSPLMTNIFSSLTAGQTIEERLVDNRPENVRGGAIAIGDSEFVNMGLQDGLWHSFQSNVTGKVISPSGAEVPISGQLGPEDFKSWGALAATLGWDLTVIT